MPPAENTITIDRPIEDVFAGAVALSDRTTRWGGGPAQVQIARASSVNAAATRNFGGTSMPSS
jgi:hypothetical protein